VPLGLAQRRPALERAVPRERERVEARLGVGRRRQHRARDVQPAPARALGARRGVGTPSARVEAFPAPCFGRVLAQREQRGRRRARVRRAQQAHAARKLGRPGRLLGHTYVSSR